MSFPPDDLASLYAFNVWANARVVDALRTMPESDYEKEQGGGWPACGAAPVPASSGKITRYRLSRGGDRAANKALHRIALVRMHCHQPTKDYLARRTAEGRTKKEILRCLKRYRA